MVRKIFIAATGQHVGKTTVSLGIINAFIKKGYKVGFIKPIGQRYVRVKGEPIDEDSVLIKSALKVPGLLKNTSPIAVEKGFTESYVLNPHKHEIKEKVLKAFNAICRGKDIVVIEGTGHGGVGSIIDFSNADMAKLLGADVLMVTGGGIGKPYDEITLNSCLFEQAGVKVLGVITNKVLQKKIPKIKRILTKALKKKNLELLGTVPYKPKLSSPRWNQVAEVLKAEILNSGHNKNLKVENVIIGAMSVHKALKKIEKQTLVITTADRDDILLASISMNLIRKVENKNMIAGIIVCGKNEIHENVLELAKKADVPLMYTNKSIYNVSAIVNDLIVKVLPGDHDKIDWICDLIGKNVNIRKVLKLI